MLQLGSHFCSISLMNSSLLLLLFTPAAFSYEETVYGDLKELPFSELPIKRDFVFNTLCECSSISLMLHCHHLSLTFLIHMLLPIVDKDESLASDWSNSLSTLRDLEQASKKTANKYALASEAGAIICDALPDSVGLGVPFVGEISCWVAHLVIVMILYIAFEVLETVFDIFQYSYDDATIGDAQVYDGYIASTDTLDNLKIFMDWTVDALGVTNQNVVGQHTAMRDELQQRHLDMEKALQQRHLDMEINLNTYMMCMTNHLGISMLKMIYPEAQVDGLTADCMETLGLGGDGRRRLRALEEVEEGGEVPSQAPSMSEMPSKVPTLPEVFQLKLTFSDGTSISSDPVDAAESEESNGSEPATASMHEMIRQIYESMDISSTSNGSNASPQNDSFVSDSNAQWYVDWVSIVVVRLNSCIH